MSEFKWTRRREESALLLSQGFNEAEVAESVGISERTVFRWRRYLDFQLEVDRLSLLVGIANRAERLRIAMQVIRQMYDECHKPRTKRDLLDWIKFAQSETDGAKLDLAAVFEAMETSAADRTRTDNEEGQESA